MGSLAIIPARGGSKRIHRKNIKKFIGKPIISYSIDLAIQSNLFDEVMVSTDDDKIAKIAQKYGADVPFIRSKVNSSDFATTMDVIHEVVNFYTNQLNKKFDYVCCIYPTAPLTTIKDLEDGYNLLVSGNYETVVPITPYAHPIQRGVKLHNERIEFINPENANIRTQDLETIYHDIGNWYWISCPISANSLITEKSGTIIISNCLAQDIDNLEDWKLAEMKYKLFRRS